MTKTIRALIAEDSEDDCLLLLTELKAGGYEPVYERVCDRQAMERMLSERAWDILLIDYMMPQFSAIEALDLVKKMDLDIPMIVVSGTIGEETAVSAMKKGAHDYLMKDNLTRLCSAIEREMREACIRKDNRTAQELVSRYASIVSSSNDMMALLDTNYTYLAVNNAYIDAVGKTNDDILGKAVNEMLDKNLFETVLKPNIDLCLTGQEVSHENWFNFPSLGSRYMLTKYSLFKGQDEKIKGIVVISTDISEKKKAEESLLLAKVKAEVANQAKSSFIANMSHEIRTPMNLVLGYSQLLEKANLNEQEREYLKIIQRRGKLLVNLLSDILDIGKIESGKFNVEMNYIDFEDTINSIVEIIKPEVARKGLVFKHEYDKRLPSNIKSNHLSIHQILLNLLNNALKFTRQGEICLYTELDEKNKAVKITVKDTGIGIALTDRKMIFDSFSQVNMTTTKEYEGAGIGLFLVKKLTDQMGGSIEVSSEIGKGSEFTVTFPLDGHNQLTNDSQQAGTNNESGFSEEEAFKQLKILEVDDDDGCSALMCIYLKELGIKEIDTAFNGEEAIEKIKKTSYDIILMDIKMPVMDGIEATKTIREKISSDLPIIAVTAFVMPEEQNIYFESGMNEFCAKPVNMKMLKEKILKLCKIK